VLSDDGVVFISIDDSEYAYLRILCDEIFGEENFIATYLWKKTDTPPSLSNKVRKKYLWTNFSNAYYYRDVRLHRHFVLSNKELNKKEVCSICSNASFSNKYMFQDDVLVIHMSDERDRDMVEQEIKKHELLLQHINNL
jgi:adenine specific DNA methylase Mod